MRCHYYYFQRQVFLQCGASIPNAENTLYNKATLFRILFFYYYLQQAMNWKYSMLIAFIWPPNAKFEDGSYAIAVISS